MTLRKTSYVMLTFCDGGNPNIIEGLLDKNESEFANFQPLIKEPWFLKFNNSAIFTPESNDPFNKLFWELGMKSFDQFMDKINSVPRKSLNLTKEVLKERKKLEDTIICLRPELDQSLVYKENIRKIFKAISENKDKMDSNENFYISFDVPKITKRDLPPGINTTTCPNCNRTCHESCAYANNSDKKNCCAISNSYCTVCPEHCFWDVHINVPFVYDYSVGKETKKADDIFKRYENAKSNLSKSEQTLNGLKDDYIKCALHCLQLQEIIQKCVEKLKQIALKKDMSESSEEFIEMMIDNELSDKKPGYLDRVAGLRDMKNQYKILKDAYKGNLTLSFAEVIEDANKMVNNIKIKPANVGFVKIFADKIKKTLKF